MIHSSVRRRTLLLAGLAAASLLAACEDKRVKELNAGISRDSAVNIIKQDLKPRADQPGAPPDSFPNVYTRERFLIAGKNIEVLYFTPENDKAPALVNGRVPSAGPDTIIPYRRLTPLVFIDGHLAGRGWSYWDSVAATNKIPLKKR
ncbi:MAG TPA: hypothetical protein VGQ44_06815 [Gemmatimonadaceae bacterium]|jgi:hypothetical protein|nr:hypothetical protein [Gemmatimonadaceae bacterium]